MGREHEANDDPREDGAMRREEAPPPLSEWIVAALGLVLVLACIAFLLVPAPGGSGAVPLPLPVVKEVRAVDGGFVVRLEVTNRSPAPAARLKLKVLVERGANTAPEEREVELQYLPGGSMREAGVYFPGDPRPGRITVEPMSYERP